jgi:acyl-coenzyme A synthetase/AMP-(fatty) acid ligase
MGMRLVDYLDKGASLGPDAPCLTTDGSSLSYGQVRDLSSRVAAALAANGVQPGDSVAIISANDPVAFSCVFGISRAGAVWCPVNPRNVAAENRELLELFDCTLVVFRRGSPGSSSRSGASCPWCGRGSASTARSTGRSGSRSSSPRATRTSSTDSRSTTSR